MYGTFLVSLIPEEDFRTQYTHFNWSRGIRKLRKVLKVHCEGPARRQGILIGFFELEPHVWHLFGILDTMETLWNSIQLF